MELKEKLESLDTLLEEEDSTSMFKLWEDVLKIIPEGTTYRGSMPEKGQITIREFEKVLSKMFPSVNKRSKRSVSLVPNGSPDYNFDKIDDDFDFADIITEERKTYEMPDIHDTGSKPVDELHTLGDENKKLEYQLGDAMEMVRVLEGNFKAGED